ncbi:MAG: glutamate--tRNA ligase [Candidatus Marsarchaeota archaeon]|nr:glutamate--tRNA ligase [Candidatus Marsarchaeota archaeon]
MLSERTKELVRKYAVKNASDYGKANEASVVNKVLSQAQDAKQNMQELRQLASRVVQEINSMSPEELRGPYANYAAEFAEEAKAKTERTAKPKMALDGAVEGAFAARYPPEPSGYMHLGHTKQIFLSQEFSKIYKGKLFLYFDDTNPKKEKQEFVDALKADLAWLGVKFDDEYYASDSIEKVYELCRRLIAESKAYACSCPPDKINKDRFSGTACEHRDTSPERNMVLFDEMLAGKYDEGKIVIRLKADMGSQNTTMRDPAIMRVVKSPHYRQGDKYKVWPAYYMNTPIMDSLHGVTDVLRDKNYEQSEELYRFILNALNMRVPNLHTFSRLRIANNITQKSEIRKLIDEGTLRGFDDPRLITIAALRRRGITPQAIREFVLKAGMSKLDTTVDMSVLLADNKRIIDQVSKRLFFVQEPVRITVRDGMPKRARLPLHPSNESLGSREYDLSDTIYISGPDAVRLRHGDMLHLKNLITIRAAKEEANSIIAEPCDAGDGVQVVQWVPEPDHMPCRVTMPLDLLDNEGRINKGSLKVVDGYVESYADKLAEHETVQFERFGFCILDRKEPLEFIFISK